MGSNTITQSQWMFDFSFPKDKRDPNPHLWVNTADDELPGKGSANAIENDNSEHTYIGMMVNNLRIIATNLGGKPELVDTVDTANVVGSTAKP